MPTGPLVGKQMNFEQSPCLLALYIVPAHFIPVVVYNTPTTVFHGLCHLCKYLNNLISSYIFAVTISVSGFSLPFNHLVIIIVIISPCLYSFVFDVFPFRFTFAVFDEDDEVKHLNIC